MCIYTSIGWTPNQVLYRERGELEVVFGKEKEGDAMREREPVTRSQYSWRLPRRGRLPPSAGTRGRYKHCQVLLKIAKFVVPSGLILNLLLGLTLQNCGES